MRKFIYIAILLFNIKAFAQPIIKANNVNIVIGAGTQLNVKGGITLVNNASVKNDGVIAMTTTPLTADWLDSTTLGAMHSASTGLVSMEEDNLQRIYGNSKFYNLTVNNTAGLLLENNVEVKNVLQLENGVVQTGANVLSTTNGQVNDIQSSTSFANSVVRGKLKRKISTASNEYFFPISKQVLGTEFYAPVTVEKVNANPASYTAEYFWATPPNVTSYDMVNIANISLLEYWNVESSDFGAAADDDGKLEISYNTRSVVSALQAQRDSLLVLQYTTNNMWEPTGGGFPSVATTGSASFGFVKHRTNIGTFASPEQLFTLGSKSIFNILPLKIIDWNAKLDNKQIQLNWLVNFPQEVQLYTVEKSLDGVNYTFFNSYYQSFVTNGMQVIDANPAAGWNYYKLYVKDIYGTRLFAGVRTVWFSGFEVKLLRNSMTNPSLQIISSSNAPKYFELINANGQVIYRKSNAQNLNDLPMANLAAGTYYLKVKQGQNERIIKFIR